jgi:hypothetical protein
MCVNNLTYKISECTKFSLLKDICSFLDKSVSNFLYKCLSAFKVISENCWNLHLWSIDTNVIQTLPQSGQSSLHDSCHALSFCTNTAMTQNTMSVKYFDTCAYTFITYIWTQKFVKNIIIEIHCVSCSRTVFYRSFFIPAPFTILSFLMHFH